MWAIEQYNRQLIKKMNLKVKPNFTLLDIGCGNGHFTNFLSKTFNLKAKGIDIYEDENWKNIINKNVQFKKGSIYNIPFKS